MYKRQVVAILYSGALSIQIGDLQQGDVIALVNYMSQVLIELVKLANLVVLVTRSLASASRIASVLDIVPEERSGAQAVIPSEVEAVSFEDVGIAYPGSGKESLSHVTFTARPGQTIGVIGGTGSGKSTLVNLIPRLYDCTSGTVKVFGRNVADYDPEQLRRAVGVVPQRSQLFSGTIRSNLCFGAPEATDAELWQALEAAQCADVVRSKPGGLEEPVEQGGRDVYKRQGPDPGQHLSGPGPRPGDSAGAEQDRPARRRPGAGEGGDREHHRPARHGRPGNLRQERHQHPRGAGGHCAKCPRPHRGRGRPLESPGL